MEERLQTISRMLPKGKVVADIGTDHAYLPIFLMEEKIATKVYACDNKQGPLNQAIEHISETPYKDKILPILCDGFQEVPMDAECAVLAGMGFYTVEHILEEAQDRLSKLACLIIQINQDVPKLREYINYKGWKIMDEQIVLDHGKYYIAIAVDVNQKGKYSEQECLLGPILMQERSQTYLAYCQHMYETYQDLYAKQTKKERKEKYALLMEQYEAIIKK